MERAAAVVVMLVAGCGRLGFDALGDGGTGDDAEGGQLGSGLRDDVATPMAVPLSCNP